MRSMYVVNCWLSVVNLKGRESPSNISLTSEKSIRRKFYTVPQKDQVKEPCLFYPPPSIPPAKGGKLIHPYLDFVDIRVILSGY
jgi:hypothetical protein